MVNLIFLLYFIYNVYLIYLNFYVCRFFLNINIHIKHIILNIKAYKNKKKYIYQF